MKKVRILSLVLALGMMMVMGSAGLAEGGERIKRGVLDIAGAEEIVERLYPGQYEVLAFPTMNEALAALKSGRVEVIQVSEIYGLILAESDDSLEYKRQDIPPASLTMLTRGRDGDLTTSLNGAIEELKESGRLDALYAQYVEGFSLDATPESPELEQLADAKTYVVGVSGDYPPFDYVSIDGNAAGYNVALMSEIAKLAGFNVKFNAVAFGSKFAALESERIDLFFLHGGLTNFEGITQTSTYIENVYMGELTRK